jgi:hypothetical protein
VAVVAGGPIVESTSTWLLRLKDVRRMAMDDVDSAFDRGVREPAKAASQRAKRRRQSRSA